MGDQPRHGIDLPFREAQHVMRDREALPELGAGGVMNPAPEQDRPLPALVAEALA